MRRDTPCEDARDGRSGFVPAGVDATLWAKQTPFRRRVYTLLLSVPAGRVTTYGALARALGCGSSRAVGQALRHNPFAPLVPCHRVIAAAGRIGGFAGARRGPDIERKLALLRAEGVRFDARGRFIGEVFIPNEKDLALPLAPPPDRSPGKGNGGTTPGP